MQPATAALGWTGTAGHLTFRPFDRSPPGEIFPLPDSLASTGGPGASSASLSSLQGSSADVIQLPDVLFSRFTEKHLYVPSSVRPSANDF